MRPEITAKKALKKGVSKRLVPPKHWSWLTLCMNGETADTVISIHEAPNLETPPKGEDARIWQTKELEYMRYNTLAVLKQLSKIGIEKNKDNALSLKAIREPLGRIASPPTRSSTVVHNVAAAGSSNLFYYLFEDTLAVVGVLGESKAVLENLVSFVLFLRIWLAIFADSGAAESTYFPESCKSYILLGCPHDVGANSSNDLLASDRQYIEE